MKWKYSPFFLLFLLIPFAYVKRPSAGKFQLRLLSMGALAATEVMSEPPKVEPTATPIPVVEEELEEDLGKPAPTPAPTRKKKAPRTNVRVASAPMRYAKPITETGVGSESTATLLGGEVAERATQWLVGLGVEVGDHYARPTAKIQIAMTGGLVAGVHGAYLPHISGHDDVAVYGAGIEVAYYLSEIAFRGLFAEGGASIYQIRGENNSRVSTTTPFVYSLTAGFNGQIFDRLRFLLGVGAEYADNRGKPVGDIYFDGLRPLVKVGLGYEL